MSRTKSRDMPVAFFARWEGVERWGKRRDRVGYGPMKRSGEVIVVRLEAGMTVGGAVTGSVVNGGGFVKRGRVGRSKARRFGRKDEVSRIVRNEKRNAARVEIFIALDDMAIFKNLTEMTMQS